MLLHTVVWDCRPEIFEDGSTALRWYGLLFGVAIVLCYLIGRRMFLREGVPLRELDWLAWLMLAGAFVGARLGHCFFYEPSYFLAHPLEIILPLARDSKGVLHFIGYQGLASHGAAIGLLATLYIWCRIWKHPFLWVVDRAVVVIAMAGALVRVGNFFNSEIYGDVTTLPWGVVFVRAGETEARHPTQLYEAMAYIAIFVWLYRLYFRSDAASRSGYLSGLFMVTLFTSRFFIEFIKVPQVDFEYSMCLDMGQWLSLPFIAAGVALLWRASRKQGQGKFTKNVVN